MRCTFLKLEFCILKGATINAERRKKAIISLGQQAFYTIDRPPCKDNIVLTAIYAAAFLLLSEERKLTTNRLDLQ